MSCLLLDSSSALQPIPAQEPSSGSYGSSLPSSQAHAPLRFLPGAPCKPNLEASSAAFSHSKQQSASLSFLGQLQGQAGQSMIKTCSGSVHASSAGQVANVIQHVLLTTKLPHAHRVLSMQDQQPAKHQSSDGRHVIEGLGGHATFWAALGLLDRQLSIAEESGIACSHLETQVCREMLQLLLGGHDHNLLALPASLSCWLLPAGLLVLSHQLGFSTQAGYCMISTGYVEHSGSQLRFWLGSVQ